MSNPMFVRDVKLQKVGNDFLVTTTVAFATASRALKYLQGFEIKDKSE